MFISLKTLTAATNHKRWGFLLLGAVIAPTWAEPAPHSLVPEANAPSAFSLAEAVADALKGDPDILLTQEKISESEANRKRAYSEVFPKLNATLAANTKKDAASSAGALFGASSYNAYATTLELSQPVFTSGAVKSGIDFYSKDLRVREQDKLITERDLTLKTILSFYAVVLAQKQLETLEKLQGIQKSLLKTAEARYRIGNEQALSVLQMKTNLLLIAPQVTSAESNVRIRASELASLTQNFQVKALNINGNLEAPAWENTIKGLEPQSPKRLEIDRNEMVSESLEANKSLRLASNYPSLYLIGSLGRSGTKKSSLFESDSTAWTVGLKLSVPLFSGLSSVYDRRVYSSQIAQNRIVGKKLVDQGTLEQVRADQEMINALTQVGSSEKAVVQARESVSVAERSYRLGTATYLQVSDTQQKLANAELSYEQGQFDLIAKMGAYFVAYSFPLDPLVQAFDRASKAKVDSLDALAVKVPPPKKKKKKGP